jgi:OHCU decarboxylase
MNEATRPRLTPIGELNLLSPSEFESALLPLFEAAGPLAAALYAERPFDSYADVIARAESVTSGLSRAAQLEVLSAHPRIGASAAALRETSALSYREQGYEREASLPPDDLQQVYAALADLNLQYEQRFGFRFVVFVNGRSKSEIVAVLQQRLRNSPDDELQTGLQAMFSIARDRLSVLAADG